MSFEAFLPFGLAAFASGAVASVVYYGWRLGSPRPPVFRYFGLAIAAGIASYLIGSFAGIGVMCSSPSSGNLCGLWGALVSGPLLAGLSLWLFGPVYRKLAGR